MDTLQLWTLSSYGHSPAMDTLQLWTLSSYGHSHTVSVLEISRGRWQGSGRLDQPGGTTEEPSEGLAEGRHRGGEDHHPEPPEDGQDGLEEAEHRAEEPDVQHREEGEEHAPEDGEGSRQEGGEEAVGPQLGLGEEDEGEPPHGVEAVGSARLRQHVVKVQVDLRIDPLGVPG